MQGPEFDSKVFLDVILQHKVKEDNFDSIFYTYIVPILILKRQNGMLTCHQSKQ